MSVEEIVVLHGSQEGGSPPAVAAKEYSGEREQDQTATDPLDSQCPVERVSDFLDFCEPIPGPHDRLEQ